MKYCFYSGAMYCELEGEEVIKEPIELGDRVLEYGDFIQKLGDKNRSSFEMNEGFYLKYEGYVESEVCKELLFTTNVVSGDSDSNKFYVFSYIDSNCLGVFNPGKGSGYEIRLTSIEIFKDVETIKVS